MTGVWQVGAGRLAGSCPLGKKSLKDVESHVIHSLILDFYPKKSLVWTLSSLTPEQISTLHMAPVFQILLGLNASKITPTAREGSWLSYFAQHPLLTLTNRPPPGSPQPIFPAHFPPPTTGGCYLIPQPVPTLLPLCFLTLVSLSDSARSG